MMKAWADGTKAVYNSASKAYFDFCKYVRGNLSMARPKRFLLFIVFMASVLKLSYNSIRSYAAGIKSLWMRDGLPDPTMCHGVKR